MLRLHAFLLSLPLTPSRKVSVLITPLREIRRTPVHNRNHTEAMDASGENGPPRPAVLRRVGTPFHTHAPPTHSQAQSPPGADPARATPRLGPWHGGRAAHTSSPRDHHQNCTSASAGVVAPALGVASEGGAARERQRHIGGVPGEHAQLRHTGVALGEHSQEPRTVERAQRQGAVGAGGAPGDPPQQQSQQHAVELTLRERALAAGAAAVLSAVIMNPLDVAKTRLQAQAAGYSYSQAVSSAPCSNCGSPWPDPITRRHLASYQLSWLSPASDVVGLRDGHHASRAAMSVSRAGLPFAAAGGAACEVSCDFPAPSSRAYRGPVDVVTRIIREEGASRLWRGTSAGLLMAVPTVGIYMPVYDTLHARLEEEGSWAAPYAPLVAGAVSRSVSCVLCAPLELARTRLQAASQPGTAAPVAGSGTPSAGPRTQGVVSILREALHRDARNQTRAGAGAGAHRSHATGASAASMPGFRPMEAFAQVARLRVLWRGVDAHLARDVPFSAICWSALEPMRKALLAVGAGGGGEEGLGRSVEEREQSVGLWKVVAANFTAGVLAGSFAAAVTTPLDVAKTRVQIEICADSAGRGVVHHLREVYREGGWRALYAGAGPRSLKAGPSVGIIVSFYEIMKYIFSKTLHEH